MDNVTVHFKFDRARFRLNYPKALTDLPIANLRKLFKYMVSEWDREANIDAIRATTTALQAYVIETKEVWHRASADYQNGFVDTKYHVEVNKRKAEANNKKLLAAVKSAKAKHERATKLQVSFDEIKAKYEIND